MHNELAEKLNTQVAGSNAVITTATVGDSSITVEAEKILEVCSTLKTLGFNVLQAITALLTLLRI